MLFLSCHVVLCFRARLCIDALWSPAGKRLTYRLSFVKSNCEDVTFPLVSWCLGVSFPDLCPFSYLQFSPPIPYGIPIPDDTTEFLHRRADTKHNVTCEDGLE